MYETRLSRMIMQLPPAQMANRDGDAGMETMLSPWIVIGTSLDVTSSLPIFFWLVAAWVKSRAERPSVSGVNRQLHVQIGCKLGIRNRKDELTKQAKRNKLQIKPEGN